MGKYQSLNVLNRRSALDDITGVDTVSEVTALINQAGNRSTRRRVEKALNKTQTITRHCNIKATEKANEQLKKKYDKDFVHFYAVLALVMYEDYRWKESEDNDHGQITSLMERVNKKMQKYLDLGYTTEDLVNLVDEKTGILLVTDN